MESDLNAYGYGFDPRDFWPWCTRVGLTATPVMQAEKWLLY